MNFSLFPILTVKRKKGKLNLRQCELGKIWGKELTQQPQIIMNTAKDRIDKFIGELPDLTKVNKSLTYQFSTDEHINSAYWKGYVDGKTELRDKLYLKENIKIEKKNDYSSDWSPDFNLTIFGEKVYDRK